MGLSRQEIDLLLKSVSLTRTKEANCDECLQELAEFAELRLDGKTIPESMQSVAHHLTICAECKEEFEALLRVLKGEE